MVSNDDHTFEVSCIATLAAMNHTIIDNLTTILHPVYTAVRERERGHSWWVGVGGSSEKVQGSADTHKG